VCIRLNTMDDIHTPPGSHPTAPDLTKMVAEKAAKKALSKAAKKRRQRQKALDAKTQDEAAARLRELRLLFAGETGALLRAEQRVRGKRDAQQAKRCAEAVAQRKAEQAKMCAEGLARQLVRDKQFKVRAAKAKKDKKDKLAKDALAEQDRAAKAAQAEVERCEIAKVRTKLQFARKYDLVACPPGDPDTPLTPAELAAFKRMQDHNRAVRLIEVGYISLLESRPQTPRAIVTRMVAGDKDNFDVDEALEDLVSCEKATTDALKSCVSEVAGVFGWCDAYHTSHSFTDLEEFNPLVKTFDDHIRQATVLATSAAFAGIKHAIEADGGHITDAQVTAAMAAVKRIMKPHLDLSDDMDRAVQEGLAR
jgi:hypothetical protein